MEKKSISLTTKKPVEKISKKIEIVSEQGLLVKDFLEIQKIDEKTVAEVEDVL